MISPAPLNAAKSQWQFKTMISNINLQTHLSTIEIPTITRDPDNPPNSLSFSRISITIIIARPTRINELTT
ncbi:hypothetical protein Ahy_A02g009346 isoform B [Arachis hypogaea]|uniref:Uncharacterized protein n=1 Tax=Arachis hypogaea TaxID=3818 RepID=A0A445EGR5_ARAHY|nr:hypothetical protein Ahy_A02g009346 isoform B [Arachis hypogaea]